MNAPLKLPEVNAHLAIIAAIDDILNFRTTEKMGLSRMWRPLEAFAPRCNCGNVLRFSPWLDGLRVAKCERCGWKCLEAIDGD